MCEAQVRKDTGVMDNIIVVDPDTLPVYPNHNLIDDNGTAQIGGICDGTQFIVVPPLPAPEPTREVLLDAATDLSAVKPALADYFRGQL